MFLLFLTGNGAAAQDNTLFLDLVDEVMANQTITGFETSLLNRAKTSLKCGSNGSISDHFYLSDFSPNWTWAFSGNWQLSMSGRADWNCKKCSCCQCDIKVQLVGSISKLYTFFYHPGGNPANIISELPAYLGQAFAGSQEYYIFQPLSTSEETTVSHCQ